MAWRSTRFACDIASFRAVRRGVCPRARWDSRRAKDHAAEAIPLKARCQMTWLGLVLVACIAGCTVPAVANKAGAIGEPVVFRLANTGFDLSGNPAAADFINRVSALSAGQMRVDG